MLIDYSVIDGSIEMLLGMYFFRHEMGIIKSFSKEYKMEIVKLVAEQGKKLPRYQEILELVNQL